MTIEQFQTQMMGLCSRLSQLHEIYWTVTDIPTIYKTVPDYWPGWVDVRFLEWVVQNRIVTRITLAPGAILDLAKDGAACALFCRHYLERQHEATTEAHKAQDSETDAVILAALTKMWQRKIEQHGKEGAVKEMKVAFPGVYGITYKEQLNKAFKTATNGQ